MAARSLWKGAISFGLVHIPVDLHSAVQDHDLDLTMLDRRDFSPIGFKRYNKTTGKDVAWDDIVKGYEYQDGEYVVLSDEDLKQANVEATQTIDILSFVPAADIPLTYYDTPYYLTPGRGGDKVYALLRETLRKADRVAIATVVIRVRQHLCALLCEGDSIILNTLRFPDEIKDTEELKLPARSLKSTGITDKEMQMALSLVDGMTEDWDPSQYHDTYREDVLELVKRKIKAKQTKTITEAAPEKKQRSAAKVVDLVALLQQSLAGGASKRGKAANDEEEDDEEAKEPVKRRTAVKKPAARKTAAKSPRTASKTARKAA
ncbi:Ku protein [Pseudoduganella ginsengisoli]|uniref:Non-homologous end joining protein Ku n=1 Tax=Pseudoduganella ginsengisoli TaxID=1462440 RepID=A0A6L6Q241_9BURK|nr:Ku protein [Pseudoduganella ginsengisoli]MTW03897.1 Ku protein [Pseudoduganella ginsengisoli]